MKKMALFVCLFCIYFGIGAGINAYAQIDDKVAVTTQPEAAMEKAAIRIQTPGPDMRLFLPKSNEIEGLIKSGENQWFIPENLWEYIDGAAGHYVDHGFQQLLTTEYSLESDPGQTIIVDIYDMGTAENGFGIYSSERDPDYNFLKVGAQGYQDDLTLNFFKGRYYVKMMAYDISEALQRAMRDLAVKISVGMDEPLDFPPELDRFPREAQVENSEELIAKNFLGQQGFDKVFTVDYKMDTITYTLFYCEFDSLEKASEMYYNLQKQTSSFKSPIKNLAKIGDRAFQVVTKYHKAVVIGQQGPKLFGGIETAYPEEVIAQMQKIKIKERNGIPVEPIL